MWKYIHIVTGFTLSFRWLEVVDPHWFPVHNNIPDTSIQLALCYARRHLKTAHLPLRQEAKEQQQKAQPLDYQMLHSLENSAQKLYFFQCCVAVCISRWTLQTLSLSVPGPIRVVCCHARDPSCVIAHTVTYMHAQTQTHAHTYACTHTHGHKSTIFQHSQLYRLRSSSWSLQDPC